ncbi:cyclic nucleotide-binding domain-containing protein, partial [Thermodesulfobacteriota bacterium]
RRQARNLFRSLSRIKILQRLPAEEAIKLIPHIKMTEFKKGETIFEENDVGDRLYFIVSGRVNVIRAVAGKSKPIATLGPGDIFWRDRSFCQPDQKSQCYSVNAD